MTQASGPEAHKETAADLPAPAVSSRELLGNGRELVILHGSERYRLLVTKSNKLLLTK
jgi:hemin uptake protein HemP